MCNTNTITIDDIQEMSLDAVKALANRDCEHIKGHDVYFADLGDPFGYSALVFFGDKHIHYANDYELHHRGNAWAGTVDKTHAELREIYCRSLNNKLFEEAELSQPLSSYDEYRMKTYFLHNYYGMRKENISLFYIPKGEADEKARKSQIKDLVFNPVCFAYYADAEFVHHCMELQDALEKAKADTVEDFEYQKEAFLREMYNHEYAINWQADYDVLSTFGNITYHGDSDNELDLYFQELHFSEIRRNAYLAARKEYYKAVNQ